MPEISRAQIATYAVLALVVVVLGVRFMQRQQPSSAVPGGAGAAASSASSGASGSTATAVRVSRAPAQASVVHVAGAVRRPGVYRLPAGARVQEAVRRAGGARRGANVNGINLAAKVVDGQQVVVPSRTPSGSHGRIEPSSPRLTRKCSGSIPTLNTNPRERASSRTRIRFVLAQ